jgi:nitroreductase
MSLQAADMGIVCHGLAGFNEEKIRANLCIPDDYAVEAMAALGYPGDESDLPLSFQKREKPRLRKPIKEIVTAGTFSF